MEDAATAEITRVQLWQWVKYRSRLDTGETITADYIDGLISELTPGVKKLVAGIKDDHLMIAGEYLKTQIRKPWASDFLTIDLMPHLAMADGVESKWVRAAL